MIHPTSSVKNDKERDSFSLNSYPNPFNTSTTNSYQLSESAFINLPVYDLSGGEVC